MNNLMPSCVMADSLLMRVGLIPLRKNDKLYFSSTQNKVTTMKSMFDSISLRKP